jgi:hypothetical protein
MYNIKTSTWIKTIGIVCIVFGCSRIISNISVITLSIILKMPSTEIMPELSPEILRWQLKLPYIGLFIHAIYILAGILFLVRKSFSLKFMYAALAVSILFNLVPLLFLFRYLIDYGYNFNNLFRLFIDVLLIIAVIRISKKYYVPGDEDSVREL